MIDTTNGERIEVDDGGEGGPLIELPLSQLDAVRDRLDQEGVSYWVDSLAVSLDGEPEMAMIFLGRSGDAARVQAILDGAS